MERIRGDGIRTMHSLLAIAKNCVESLEAPHEQSSRAGKCSAVFDVTRVRFGKLEGAGFRSVPERRDRSTVSMWNR